MKTQKKKRQIKQKLTKLLKRRKAPVIIRREVLIEEKGKEEVKKQSKSNNVGFVERNKTKTLIWYIVTNKPQQ